MKNLLIIILLIAAVYLGMTVLGSPEPTDRVPTDRVATLYYYDPERDTDENDNIMCSREGLVGVTREVNENATAEDIINLLLAGQLTEEEREQGIETEFPLEEVTLESADLTEDGTLTLTFNDPLNRTSGGSCRTGILWFQIEQTALELPGVNAVTFEPEELFQP